MSDRLAVMNRGWIEQIDTPQAIYDQPATSFVAEFVGENNRFYGVVQQAEPDGLASVLTPQGLLYCRNPLGVASGHAVAVYCRPEHSLLFDAQTQSGMQTTDREVATRINPIPGQVERVDFEGAFAQVYLRLQTQAEVVEGPWSSAMADAAMTDQESPDAAISEVIHPYPTGTFCVQIRNQGQGRLPQPGEWVTAGFFARDARALPVKG